MEPVRIKLDLEKVDVFGWRGQVSGFVIDKYLESLRQGQTLPSVSLYQINPTTYQLIGRKMLLEGVDESHVGGHYRAVAHFHGKLPLEALIVGHLPEVDLRDYKPVKIGDVKVFYDIWAKAEFERRIKK